MKQVTEAVTHMPWEMNPSPWARAAGDLICIETVAAFPFPRADCTLKISLGFFVTIANFLGCAIFAVLSMWGPNCWLWKLYRTHQTEESRTDSLWLITWMVYFPSTSVQSDRTWKSASFSHCMAKQPGTRYHCLLSQDGVFLPGSSEGFTGSVQSYSTLQIFLFKFFFHVRKSSNVLVSLGLYHQIVMLSFGVWKTK